MDNEQEIAKSKAGQRFRTLVYFNLTLLIVSIVVLFFTDNIYLLDRILWVLFGVTGLWISVDVELLRIKQYFMASLFIGVVFLGFGAILLFLNPSISKLSTAGSISLLSLLLVQWPTRRIYIALFKREPEFTGDYGSVEPFVDVFYSIIIFFGGFITIPLIIVDYIR